MSDDRNSAAGGSPRLYRWTKRLVLWIPILAIAAWQLKEFQPQQLIEAVQDHHYESGDAAFYDDEDGDFEIDDMEDSFSLYPSKTGGIRKWGCHRTQTPFFYIHIGKSGGGNIRTRIATSAIHFEFGPKRNWRHQPQAYFPVTQNNKTYSATFCNSGYRNYEPNGLLVRSYEGTLPCNATTPIGQALACPEVLRTGNTVCPADPTRKQTAHVLYAGHNTFGFELHWLPVPFLEQWWQKHWTTGNQTDPILEQWKTLDGIHSWCNGFTRPMDMAGRILHKYYRCGRTMEPRIDQQTIQVLSEHRNMNTNIERARAYSDIYASLPVLRVTVLREPYSWILSKFFWSKLHNKGLVCDDIGNATYGSLHPDVYLGASSRNIRLINAEGRGWLRRMALGYIKDLCGEDCGVRLASGQTDLEEIVTQAEYNLRNGIAVVGLLHEMDSFYDMVTARVDYLELTKPSAHAQALEKQQTHLSHGGREKARCAAHFKDPNFRTELEAACPELAALIKLYNVGVEVNRFQKEELGNCTRRRMRTR